ncbi:MAG: amidohydrolase, partial [Chloroflexi bacterium]|nr:amidohydrolase [Chloroflexota bacterium]
MAHHPLRDTQSPGSALAIQGERLLALGSDDEILALRPPQSAICNLQSRPVIPGLTDSHLHFEWYSLSLQAVDARTDTKEEILRRVKERADRTPPGEWIFGRGWNQTRWPDARFPAAADLDAAASDHPAYLIAQSGHAGWANSLALKRVGITDNTPNPPGGEFQRDAHGCLTGVMLEDACWAFREAMPRESEEDVARAMLPAFENAWKVGLTGVHDFDGVRCFVAYQLLKERGQLGLRVVKNIPVAHLEGAVGVGLRSGFGDHWLRIGNVKIFADGALGPRSAAMFEPYEGEPGNRGIVVTDKEEIYEKGRLAAEHGLALTVHAIGDRANHDLLDVYEKLREEEISNPKSQISNLQSQISNLKLRHRVEHLQVVHPDDLTRAARLGVIVSMQPIHATSDMLMVDRYWGARGKYAYTFKTQLDSGATL